MKDLISTAAELQAFVIENIWDFFFIGGVAVQVWGQPRLTKDVDITIFTNLRNEEEYIRRLLERYLPKFSDIEEFALTERVLPIKTESGIGIGVTLGGLSDINAALERSSYQEFTEEISLKICSAEDLIIMKAVADRPRDWGDVESVITKQSPLDWEYIEGTLKELEDYDDMAHRLARVLQLKDKHYKG